MAFFDKLKNQATAAVTQAVKQTAANIGSKTEKIVFADIPESLEAFEALPQTALSTPFDTADNGCRTFPAARSCVSGNTA